MRDILLKSVLVVRTFRCSDLLMFARDFFGISAKGEIHKYILRDKSQMLARSSTTDVREIAMVFSDYEYPKKYFQAKHSQIIFDLGANIGSFSIYAADVLKFYQPIIYAFEPSNENYNMLNKNIQLSKSDNIKPYKYAISSRSGEGFLDTSLDCDSYHLGPETSKGEKVNLITLPAFCSQHSINTIDLLKIDIEGGEYDLVEHSLDFIHEHVRFIFIEIHDVDDKAKQKSLLERFSALGFVITPIKQTYFMRNICIC